jgi:hypothetical protein
MLKSGKTDTSKSAQQVDSLNAAATRLETINGHIMDEIRFFDIIKVAGAHVLCFIH